MERVEFQYDVAIVGSGFSGAMVAIHLARQQRGLRVALIGRAKDHGRGVAYGTSDPRHLLNVRANQMGAFPEEPGHFYHWLQAHPEKLTAIGMDGPSPDAFVPRMIFGDYIQDLLARAQDAQDGRGKLDLISDEIVDLVETEDKRFELLGKSRKKVKAGRVVLALGNFPPDEFKRNVPGLMNDPYSPETHKTLAEPGDILIIGTGLTSLDVLMTLDRTKRKGKIHLLSLRGLFPQTHQKAEPYHPFINPDYLPATARELLNRVRREIHDVAAKGIGWRSVVDSLRPLHQSLWTNLSVAEQRRFLRHVQGFWDTHRHRCAPEVMAVKERLEKEGRLVCHQGRIQDVKNIASEGAMLEVAYQPRGTHKTKTLRVNHVLSCAGPQADVRKLNDTFVQRLLERDLLAPHPLRMGISTSDEGQVCRGSGALVKNLYTLGSIQKGRLYESVAVPELRKQAADLASRLSAEMEHHLKTTPVAGLSVRAGC